MDKVTIDKKLKTNWLLDTTKLLALIDKKVRRVKNRNLSIDTNKKLLPSLKLLSILFKSLGDSTVVLTKMNSLSLDF